jgi:hypothetical protein
MLRRNMILRAIFLRCELEMGNFDLLTRCAGMRGEAQQAIYVSRAHRLSRSH